MSTQSVSSLIGVQRERTDSWNQLVIDVELQPPNASSNLWYRIGKDALRSARITEKSESGAGFTGELEIFLPADPSLRLKSREGAYIAASELAQQVITPLQSSAELYFGRPRAYADRNPTDTLYPRYACILTNVRVHNEHAGYVLNFDIAARNVLRPTLQVRARYFEAWRSVTVREVLDDICSEYGWALQCNLPTTGLAKRDYRIHTNETIFKFLQRIADETVDAFGMKCVVGFDSVKQGSGVGATLVFGSRRGLLLSGEKVVDITTHYFRYFRDLRGEVLSFEAGEDAVLALSRLPSAYVYVDENTGAPMFAPASLLGGVFGAGLGVFAKGFEGLLNTLLVSNGTANENTQRPDQGVSLVHGDSDTAREKAVANHMGSAGLQTATMTVVGNHNVSPFDVIFVDYYNAAARVHAYSGFYIVSTIEHDVSGSGWTSTYTLQRQGYKPDTVGTSTGAVKSASGYRQQVTPANGT